MLSNTLNTNEIKNSSGTEIEFSSLEVIGRKRVFAKVSESPAAPHRLTISHQEIGKDRNKRRRSVVRFDYTSVSDVDAITPVVNSCYIVLDTPVGELTDTNDAKMALANLLSFCATTGSGTTVLFDCTGNGAAALIEGSL